MSFGKGHRPACSGSSKECANGIKSRQTLSRRFFTNREQFSRIENKKNLDRADFQRRSGHSLLYPSVRDCPANFIRSLGVKLQLALGLIAAISLIPARA